MPSDTAPAPPSSSPAPPASDAPKSFAKYRRMLTVGHAIAAVALVVVVYEFWGKVFEPGGTGSNVVLGLLVAIAIVYLGATNIGPSIDDVLSSAPKRRERRLVREAADLTHDVDALVKRAKKGKEKKVDAAQADVIAAENVTLSRALVDVENKRDAASVDALEAKLGDMHKLLEKEMGTEKASAAFVAQAKSLGVAFLVAIALRLFLVAPFQIPSGSMIPTLLIGDHLFVFRAMYGLQSPFGETPSYWARWAMPKAGDVVVFEAPPWVGHNAGDDWIKRVIALPGQKVKRKGITVYVDDKPLTLTGGGEPTRYMDHDDPVGPGPGRWHEAIGAYHQEDDQGQVHDTFTDLPPSTTDWPCGTAGEPLCTGTGLGFEPRVDQRGLACTETECTVQPGFVFVMGDNRDHSSDGRVWGAVPADNIKGKALFIWVSVDGSEESVHLGKFTLPRFRWERVFRWIR